MAHTAVLHRSRHGVQRVSALIVLSLVVTLTGMFGAVEPAGAVTPTTELPLYVSNFDNNSITAYAPGANSDAVPIATIAGPATGLNRPLGIVIDSSGKLYVANSGNDTITVYGLGASGNAAPIATIGGPNTGLRGPQGMALDANDVLYVSNFGLLPGGQPASSITAYAPGANGNVAPIATIAGPNTGLRRPSALALDSSGRIYAANFAPPPWFPGAPFPPGLPPGSIVVFPAGANGNVAPVATITDSTTGLRGIQSMTVDSSGNLYVTQTFAQSVTKYPPGANGNVAPIATIAGPHTGLGGPIGIVVDAGGRITVANYNIDTVTKFAPGASGDVAPVATIAGPNTGLNGPEGLALAVNCRTVFSGAQRGTLVASSATTCLPGANLTGQIIVRRAATLLAQRSTVFGPVAVGPGATVVIDGSTIAGTISATSPGSFRLCGSIVGGAVVIRNPQGPVIIGDTDDPSCAPNTIRGGVFVI